MTYKLAMAVLAAFFATGAIAGAPSLADIAAVGQFLDKDNSYSPAAKAEARQLASQLGQYLGDEPRFELEVVRIVALADNGHTAIFPPQWTLRYPRSPVRVGLFSDGLYVIAAPSEYAAALGKPVATINGQPWQQVRRAYSAFQGGAEQFKDQFFPIFAETPALLEAAGLGSDPSRLHLTLSDGQSLSIAPVMAPLKDTLAGNPMPRDATALVKGPLPLYLLHPDELYYFAELPEEDAAYIRIDGIYGKGLEAFLSQSLERLRAGKQRNIILDLRFDMGGDLNRARDFAKALPGLAKGGRIYVITSGRTFSAAISTTGYVKQADPAKVRIVGEPVGDRLEFWAEGDMIELPGLGAKILHATERHNYQTGCQEADCHEAIRQNPIRVASLQPDLPAPLTFDDYVAGRDPAMEAIAKDIGGRR